MKLTYWVIPHQSDASCYNIRAKTKKAALAMAAEHWCESAFLSATVKKVTVEYADAFDLMEQCLEEGSGCWESWA